MQTKLVKRDTLPEFMDFPDNGCSISPHCLTCPLPSCRYDNGQGLVRAKLPVRNETIIKLYNELVSIPEIALFLGVSVRTVYRALDGQTQSLA